MLNADECQCRLGVSNGVHAYLEAQKKSEPVKLIADHLNVKDREVQSPLHQINKDVIFLLLKHEDDYNLHRNSFHMA